MPPFIFIKLVYNTILPEKSFLSMVFVRNHRFGVSIVVVLIIQGVMVVQVYHTLILAVNTQVSLCKVQFFDSVKKSPRHQPRGHL